MPLGAIPFPFGICRICKDKATGVHYGVTTCEGCKGFFKRSITRGDKYKCFFGSDCDLTPKNRNRCKSCRFKKCLEVGMSVEAVRMGRIPKVEKERALEVFHQGGSDFKNLEIEVEMTGTGTYDFKINPKDNTEYKYLETGLQTQLPQREVERGQPETQSDSSPILPYAGENNLQKVENANMEEKQLPMEQHPYSSADASKFTQSHVMKNHTRMSVEFNPYLNSQMAQRHQGYHQGQRASTNQITPAEQSYLSGQRSSNNQMTPTQQSSPPGQMSFTNQRTPIQQSSPPGQTSLTNQITPIQQSYSAGQRSSTNQISHIHQSHHPGQRTSTVTSQELLKSETNKHLVNTSDYGPALEQYACDVRKQQDNFKVPFDSFTRNGDRFVPQGTNYEQWQSGKPASAGNYKCHLDFGSDVIQAPCGNSDYRFPTHISGQNMNGKSSTLTGPFDESQTVQQYNTSEQNCVNTAVGQLRLNSDLDQRTRIGYTAQHQQLYSQKSPDIQHKASSYMTPHTDGKPHPDPCYGFMQGSISSGKNGILDYGIKPEHQHPENLPLNKDQQVHQCSLKSADRAGSFDKLQHYDSMTDFDSESLSGPIRSDYSESIDNFRCPSPGSVVSREGSNSSQRSGYSTAIIQILLDQLLESDQVATFANNLKKKLDTPQAEVVERLLKMVDSSAEKSKHPSESKKLSELPEDKLDGMNRFLKDLNGTGNRTEAPLLKKKRCIEDTELKASFENLDVESHMEVPTLNDLESSRHSAKRPPNPYIARQCGTSKVSVSSHLNSSSSNISISAKTSANQNPDYTDSQKASTNQNPDYTNSQKASTNDMATKSVQNVSASMIGQTDQDFSSRAPTESAKQIMADESTFLDNVVSSTVSIDGKEETSSECEEKLQQTINSMNLAMKILNRFKPEHREKIRLFKQGQLHIQILTDSDEDCSAIYKKLMDGISGLNDRILGFCESVPGFLDLCKEDREKLVKRSYYDMWTLSYSEYFQNGQSFWILPTGEIYSARAMRKILNDEMVDTIMTFADSYNKLGLTDLETALFSAVRLTTTSEVELEDMQMVEKLHSHLLDTLAFEVKRNHHSNHMQLLMNVFKLVPLIESINRIQSQIIANFSLKRFSKEAKAADEKKLEDWLS